MRRDSFIQQVFKIALPVALQCMLQSSFSIVDQIMVGSLGSVSVAAVGIAGKLSTLYSVVIGAVVSVAGIILSQYLGANDNDEADRGFREGHAGLRHPHLARGCLDTRSPVSYEDAADTLRRRGSGPFSRR